MSDQSLQDMLAEMDSFGSGPRITKPKINTEKDVPQDSKPVSKSSSAPRPTRRSTDLFKDLFPLPPLSTAPTAEQPLDELTPKVETKADQTASEPLDKPLGSNRKAPINLDGVVPGDKAAKADKSAPRLKKLPSLGLPEDKEISERTVDKPKVKSASNASNPVTDTSSDPFDEILDPNPIVSADGRTLEDMLISMQGSQTSLSKRLVDFKSGQSSVEINGKLKPDSRFTKHDKVISDEKKSADRRKAASKKYVQRNSRYTEEEKIIMKNLGLNPNDFTTMLSKKSNLSSQDKARLLQAGARGEERHFKGKRFRATIGDQDIITFLAKFKFANTRILSRLRSEPIDRTWRKLNRLKIGGVVADSEVIGMGTIWYLTEGGMALSGYELPTMRRKRPKTSTLPPIIGINHIAACLWNNEQNVLGLEEFPSTLRRVHKAGKADFVVGETLVSELEIRSSLAKEADPSFGGGRPGNGLNMYTMVGERARARWYEWEVAGKDLYSPEFEIGNEYLWVLYPKSNMTKSFHVPDLIVSRPRAEDGSPRSIAVELELNGKSLERYHEILLAYKLDEHLYEKVIWVTNNNAIMKKLVMAAEEVGLTKFDVVPVTNENGIYNNRDIWHI